MPGPIVLNPTGIYITGFNVPDEAKTACLNGNFAIYNGIYPGGATLTIWTQEEFLN